MKYISNKKYLKKSQKIKEEKMEYDSEEKMIFFSSISSAKKEKMENERLMKKEKASFLTYYVHFY